MAAAIAVRAGSAAAAPACRPAALTVNRTAATAARTCPETRPTVGNAATTAYRAVTRAGTASFPAEMASASTGLAPERRLRHPREAMTHQAQHRPRRPEAMDRSARKAKHAAARHVA